MRVLKSLIACAIAVLTGLAMILSLQPVHAADAFLDGGWPALNAQIQQLKNKGDYKLAFDVLDHYIRQRVEWLYPYDFPLLAVLRQRAHFRQMRGERKTELISLWNTISMDAEDLGRDDPIVGYDYAAIGDAYAALNDFKQAEPYYSQAIKILSAAFR